MKLLDCLDGIEDPRNASGRRYKLGPIMKLLLTGLLSGRPYYVVGKKFKLWCIKTPWL